MGASLFDIMISHFRLPRPAIPPPCVSSLSFRTPSLNPFPSRIAIGYRLAGKGERQSNARLSLLGGWMKRIGIAVLALGVWACSASAQDAPAALEAAGLRKLRRVTRGIAVIARGL